MKNKTLNTSLKLFSTLFILIFMETHLFADSKNPCLPYSQVCEAGGYKFQSQKGGTNLPDCITKLIKNEEVKSLTTGAPIIAPANADPLQCSAHLKINHKDKPEYRTELGQNSNHPCQPFKKACMSAGFQSEGQAKGNRLISDCMLKLLDNQPVTSITGATVTPPTGPGSDDASKKACMTHIHSGPKPLAGIKAQSAKAPPATNK